MAPQEDKNDSSLSDANCYSKIVPEVHKTISSREEDDESNNLKQDEDCEKNDDEPNLGSAVPEPMENTELPSISSASSMAVPRTSLVYKTPVYMESRQNSMNVNVAPSLRRLFAARQNTKATVMAPTESQVANSSYNTLLGLEDTVEDLYKENSELKRKVTMFQDLFRNREKLDQVLKRLDENKKDGKKE